MKIKSCKYCKEETPTHWPYQCWRNPYIKKYGWRRAKGQRSITNKYGRRVKIPEWQGTRKKWFVENAAEYYVCYLCGKSMLPIDTTLDHVIPRSKGREYKFDIANLKPCCWECNSKKGSQSLENYKKNIKA